MKKVKTRINKIYAKLLRKLRIHKAKAKAKKLNKIIKKWNNNDYHFYIIGEQKIHFHVGSQKKLKAACRNYKEWKRCLLIRHNELLTEENRQNFLKYLFAEIRKLKNEKTVIINVLTPILVAILTIFAALAIAKIQTFLKPNENGATILSGMFDSVLAVVLVIAVVIEIALLYNYSGVVKKLALLEDVRSAIKKASKN